jgi:hypothetical protein
VLRPSQYGHCSLLHNDGKHDHADNDKYSDILSRRQVIIEGLVSSNEREEFDDNERKKDLERVDDEFRLKEQW